MTEGPQALVLYNVGQSDLTIDGVDKRAAAGDVRAWTERGLRRLERDPSATRATDAGFELHDGGRLGLPILTQLLRTIEADGYRVRRLVLFTSDQEGVEGGRPETDTLHVAQVLRRFVEQSRPDCEVLVETWRAPVNDHDRMLEAYRAFFAARGDVGRDVDRRIACVTPGTPAMALALLLRGLEAFRGDLSLLNVSDRGSGEVQALELGRRLADERARQLLLEALEQLDYPGALAQARLLREPRIEALLRAAMARWNFAFDDAARELEEARRQGDTWAAWSSDIRGITRGNATSSRLLVELRHAFSARARRRAVLEAVALLFRLAEETLQHEAARVAGLARYDRAAVEGWVRGQPELVQRLADNKTELYQLDSRLGLEQLIRVAVELLDEAGRARRERVLALANALKPLADLRNGSPYGHGLRGIGVADVDDVAPGGLRALRNVVDKALEPLLSSRLDLDRTPYDDLNEHVRELLS